MERRSFLRTGLAGFGVAGLTASPLGATVRGRAFAPLFNPRAAADGVVKLNSNENPLGVAPSAREAVVGGLDEANRYPGATGEQVFAALSEHLGVPADHIFLGAGSTEILRVSVQAWAGPGARLIYAQPTFEDVPGYAKPFPFEHVTVPLTSGYEHDLPRMREEAEKASGPTIVYVCNPNNPTGGITPTAPIEAWMREAGEQTLFLIDEAYFELVDDARYRTAIPFVSDMPNVIVVRTFSKIFAMAGMRLGYGVAHPATVRRIAPFTTRNNPNHLAGVAAVASLADPELIGRSIAVNDEARTLVTDCLDDLGIEHLPSQTNFIMHRIRGELLTYNNRMMDAGFAVGRPFPPMLDWSRLSMGMPDDMARFAETLRDFRSKDWI
ncbi:MAG: histidinol-phosphate transaminase [Gemmatimonadota bacterium]|nr:histidinol-phosphate transaminase [Gemmatimonadota bacterium]